MKYPLQLKFKLLAVAKQIYVSDASDKIILYVKQKAFKLKEDITVFADESQSQPLYKIGADRIIDFSASYNFTDQKTGKNLGSIKRKGMRSLWKAHYEIYAGDKVVMSISEENPWAKVGDALMEQIPIVGVFSGFLFHPAYIIRNASGKDIFRLKKQAAWFEGKFQIEKLSDVSDEEETRSLLSLLMMILLERSRG